MKPFRGCLKPARLPDQRDNWDIHLVKPRGATAWSCRAGSMVLLTAKLGQVPQQANHIVSAQNTQNLPIHYHGQLVDAIPVHFA